MLRSAVFADFGDWMLHGFGTRHALTWPGGETATLRQIHSGEVLVAECPGELGQGDALITATPGVSVAIRTADCVPLLFADPVRRVVAAAHAGWRGTAAQIARKTVERMRADFGCAPGDIRAAIGPAIGVCCYEVSGDVAERFLAAHLGGKAKLDLAAINRAQLLEAGLAPVHIDAPPYCTLCDAQGRFHSFRRDGERSGRMRAAAGIRL